MVAPVSCSPWSIQKNIIVYKIPTIEITPTPSLVYCLTTENDKKITFKVSNLPSGYSLVLYYKSTYLGQPTTKRFCFFCDDEQVPSCYTITADGTYTTRLAYGAGVYEIRAIIKDNWDFTLGTLTLDKPSTTITAAESSGISSGDDKICEGSSVTLTASEGSSYWWSGGGGTSRAITVSPTSSTSYTVKVTNANGCSASASKDIVVNAIPAPTISGPASSCQGVTGNLYSTEQGMSGYIWSIDGGTPTAGGTDTSNTVTVTWNTPGTGKVKVNYTNGNGCTANSQTVKNVMVNPKPTIALGAMPSVCYGTAATALIYTATTEGPDQLSIDFSSGIPDVLDAALTANQIPINLPNNLLPGVYSGVLTLRNSTTGCISDSYSLSVTVKELPDPTLEGPLTICSGSTGNIYTTEPEMTNYTWAVDGGTISAGGGASSNSATITWGAAGVGHVKVNYTSGNGCMAATQKDMSVTINPLPNTSFLLGDPIICYGKPAAITQSTGENGVFYQLRMASDNVGDPIEGNGLPFTYPSVSPALTTEYSVLAKIDATGCSAILTDKAAVKVNPLPVPTFTSGPTVACANVAGNVYATQLGMSNYQWSVTDGTITSGGTAASSTATITWNAVNNGAVTVNYNDANGCTAETPTSSEVTISNLRFDLPVLTHLKCNGDKGGAIKIVARDGIPPYTYFLKRGSTIVGTNENGEFKNLDAASDYRVIVTDFNTCSIESEDISINQPPVLLIESLGLTHVNCKGFSTGAIVPIITGRTSQQLSYLWSGPDGYTSTARNISGLKAGLYTLKVLDGNSCSATLDSTIKQPAENLEITVPTITNNDCNGGYTGKISIAASGGTLPYRFTLTGGGITPATSTNGNFEGLPAATNYSVTVTDNNLCTATVGSIIITQPTDPFTITVTNSQNISCHGGGDGWAELQVSGGTPSYQFSKDGSAWVSLVSPYKFDNLAYSDKPFSVRDSEGCVVTAVNPVTQPNPILPAADITQVICKGESNGKISLTVTGGTGQYTLTLTDTKSATQVKSNVINAAEFDGLKADTYTLDIKDANNCSISKEFKVLEPTSPISLTFTPILPSCNGLSDGEIAVVPAGGWGKQNYSFANLSNGSVYSNGKFSGVSAGTYPVSVTDSLGCPFSSSVILDEPTKLVVKSIQETNLKCFEDGTGVVKVISEGGTPGYQYDFGAGFQSVDSLKGLQIGTYHFTIRDSHGCMALGEATVTQPDPLAIIKGNGQILECTDNVLITPVGGTAPYNLLVNGLTVTCPATGYLIDKLPNGIYPIVLTDDNKCLVNDEISLSSFPAPKIKLISVTDASCANTSDGQIVVEPYTQTLSVSVKWDDIFVGNTYSGLKPNSYKALATDEYGCKHDTTITVGSPPAILLSLAKQRVPKCFGSTDGNLSVTASGRSASDFRYVWYNMAQSKISETDSTGAIPSGEYMVVVSDLVGCSDTSYYSINDPPTLQPNLPSVVTICSNQTYVADAGVPGTSFLWSSAGGYSATGRTATLTDAGVYTLLVTDSKGCSGRDTLTLVKSGGIIDANFIMADRACVGDTLVLIEVSWPIPEAIEWRYEASFVPIFSTSYSVYLVPQMTGTFSIGLTSHVGDCWADIYRTIIVEPVRVKDNRLASNQSLIKDVVAFPNPNRGDFSVEVNLNQESDVLVEVYSVYGKRLYMKQGAGLSAYKVDVNLFHTPGIYLVRIAAGGESQSLRVVVE